MVLAKMICFNTNPNCKADYKDITNKVTWFECLTNIVANINDSCNPKGFELPIADRFGFQYFQKKLSDKIADICPANMTNFYGYSDGKLKFYPLSVKTAI